MYDVLPSFVLGFHGCDEAVAERIFAGKSVLKPSQNDYDWLGHGVYFWEHNPRRALAWAKLLKQNPVPKKTRVHRPAVVGAIIDLGRCLNLLDAQYIEMMKLSYCDLKRLYEQAGAQLPINNSLRGSKDLLLRHLDCAVVEMLHAIRKRKAAPPFQSVRGAFIEGPEIYPGAGIHERNHIQICVRDPQCIKGYFRVLREPRQPKNGAE